MKCNAHDILSSYSKRPIFFERNPLVIKKGQWGMRWTFPNFFLTNLLGVGVHCTIRAVIVINLACISWSKFEVLKEYRRFSYRVIHDWKKWGNGRPFQDVLLIILMRPRHAMGICNEAIGPVDPRWYPQSLGSVTVQLLNFLNKLL